MTNPPFKKTTVARMAIPSMAEHIQHSLRGKRSERGDNLDASRLNYDCSSKDMQMILAIADRCVAEARANGVDHIKKEMVAQDIATVHCNGTPLNLLQILLVDSTDFRHDVVGIGVHLDRTSGKLLNDFKPLFAVEKH